MASVRYHPPTPGAQPESSTASSLLRRLRQGAQPETVLLRRRRRIATCLACVTGAAAFFGLYVLSWMLVLDI